MLLLWILVWGLLLDKSMQIQMMKQPVETISQKPASPVSSQTERTVPKIRVLLMTTGYESYAHQKVSGICGQEDFSYTADSPAFKESNIIRLGGAGIKTTVTSIERQCGAPVYSGTLEIHKKDDGLYVVNEVPLETYLESVVPSEMPPSYEKEALKAQAVCARTYAWKHMSGKGIEICSADVDDSVNYQVYGNIEVQETSSLAVRETKGQILCHEGEPVEAYYFSTSSGATSTDEIWGAKTAAPYLKSVDCPFDSNLSWSNWETAIPWETIQKRAQEKAEKQESLRSLEIIRKTQSGASLELQVTMETIAFAVEGEYAIREFLSPKGCSVTGKDGTVTAGGTLLPSSYFSMEILPGEKVLLKGSGYGHGVGMSQNAANEMAKEGYTCHEILDYFFRDVSIESCI
ncbi:MAG: SpoIID/LytB domain-containing protein [Blautia sp.]|nr:SpoIID/LytB domain-containing protein [Blautia sp.]